MEISNVHKKGDDVIALLDQTKVCSILCYKKNWLREVKKIKIIE